MNDDTLKYRFSTSKRPTGSDFTGLIEAKRRRDEGRVIVEIGNNSFTLDDGTVVPLGDSGAGSHGSIPYAIWFNSRRRDMLSIKYYESFQNGAYVEGLIIPNASHVVLFDLEFFDADILLKNPVLHVKRYAPKRIKNGFVNGGKVRREVPAGFYAQPDPVESYDRRSRINIISLRQTIDLVAEGYFFLTPQLTFGAKTLTPIARAQIPYHRKKVKTTFDAGGGDDFTVITSSGRARRRFLSENGAYVYVQLLLEIDTEEGRMMHELTRLKVFAARTGDSEIPDRLYISQVFAR